MFSGSEMETGRREMTGRGDDADVNGSDKIDKIDKFGKFDKFDKFMGKGCTENTARRNANLQKPSRQ